jgi:hypothetical protein
MAVAHVRNCVLVSLSQAYSRSVSGKEKDRKLKRAGREEERQAKLASTPSVSPPCLGVDILRDLAGVRLSCSKCKLQTDKGRQTGKANRKGEIQACFE